jgi:hypothetical protein
LNSDPQDHRRESHAKKSQSCPEESQDRTEGEKGRESACQKGEAR